MATKNDSFLQETLEFWQARTTRILTLEDAREIAENIGVFFEVFVESEEPFNRNLKAQMKNGN
jgi:hypothetical protein